MFRLAKDVYCNYLSVVPHRKKGELYSFFFIRCHHLLSKLAKIRQRVYENQLHHKLKRIGTRYLIGVVIDIMLLDIVWEACFLSRSISAVTASSSSSRGKPTNERTVVFSGLSGASRFCFAPQRPRCRRIALLSLPRSKTG